MSAPRTLSQKTALGLLFITAAIVSLYLLRPLADPDFFWHLKTGQWIWQQHRLPGLDPFSLAPPSADDLRASFILTSYWISQLVYAALYALGGWWGIALLRVALVGAMAGLYADRCDLRQPLQVSLLLLFAVQFLEVYPLDRPQTFSFVFFALLLVLFDRYRASGERGGGVRSQALLVAGLMFLWANMHGGFLVGQVTLTLLLVMEGVKFLSPALVPMSSRRYRNLAIIVLAGLAASFLHPQGLDGLRLFSLVTDTNNPLYTTNIEYSSSWEIFREYRAYTVVLNWLLMALVVSRALFCWRRPEVTWLALLGGTAFMGCQHIRYMPFFLIAALFYLGKGSYTGRVAAYLQPLGIALTLGAAIWFARDETSNFTPLVRGQWGVAQDFPVSAADFILAQNLPGPIYNPVQWGGYFIWRLGPERKIYCDGRQLDAIRNWEYLSTTIMVQGDSPYWKEVFHKNGIQTAVVQMVDPANPRGGLNPLAGSLRRSPEWIMVFAQDNAAIFVNKEGMK